jgi:anti-sigma regulatory factor (Ser/Thr protein kinase)
MRVAELESARGRGWFVQFYDPEGERYGIPTYPYLFAPDGLMTMRQLRAYGLRPGGQDPAAQILWRHRGRRRVAYLYWRSLALPKRTATAAQLAAIGRALAARKTCPTCGQVKPYCIARSLGECNDCADAARRPAAEVTARFPGRPEAAHAARDLARAVLGPGHPCRDDADLCATELVANAVAYSRSGLLPGGTVTVTVQAEPRGALIRVRDQGGPGAPAPGSAPAGLGEHGRGLVLVGALAAEWGTETEGAGRVTWCRLAAAEVAR